MSIIGPRRITDDEIDKYADIILSGLQAGHYWRLPKQLQRTCYVRPRLCKKLVAHHGYQDLAVDLPAVIGSDDAFWTLSILNAPALRYKAAVCAAGGLRVFLARSTPDAPTGDVNHSDANSPR